MHLIPHKRKEGRAQDVSETEYLLSIPGMCESIQQGMNENISEGSQKVELQP